MNKLSDYIHKDIVIRMIGMVLFLMAASGCTPNREKGKAPKAIEEVSLTAEERLPRPLWVSDYPVVFVGNWDDMSIFRLRRGGSPVWQEEDYKKTHTEEAVIKLKEMGVTMAIIHFFKGFGLEAEKEHMDDARKLAGFCKKHGIKIGVYVGSTICYETFLLEEPDAEEWFVPDYLGRPVRYWGTQTFRKRVYFMHPGYINYMKRVVRIAIEDFDADLIHFDNTSNQARHDVYSHPMAIENFRTYLENKYTPEQREKRFGFSEVRYMEPPEYDRPLSTIDDPMFQEWTGFRCQELADYYGIMERYIHSLNPEVAIDNNPHSGMGGANTMWDQGVDYPKLTAHTDFIWSEEGYDASVMDNGVLLSKIRSYKMAQTLNNRIFTYTSSNTLEMAQAMAYNRQGMGMVGSLLAGYELPEDQRNYIRFYHDQFEYYRDIQSVADVAVLHSYATMAFNNDRPYESTYLFEQILIQEKIPFDIIFDDNLKDLSKYKVLVLADQECLSDEELDLIRDFVIQGGGLVATGATSLYTEWRQRKREFGLKELFGVEAPGWHGRGSREDILDIPVQKNEAGKGRVVYLPGVEPSIQKPPTTRMYGMYWKLPVNWKELLESVEWASGNSLSIAIEAPQTVTMELVEMGDHSAMILHLLNYKGMNSPVYNIEVDVQVPEGKQVAKISVLTPDSGNEKNLQFRESGERIVFSVPQLLTYNMVVMKLE
ncbi:MAG: alpha-amylase family protein [Bacteroidota bacterium]